MISLTVNGQVHEIDVEPDKPLLWVLREDLNIVGPKFGCGVAACGACTVHVDRAAVRSCSFPVSEAAGKVVVTVEGLAKAASCMRFSAPGSKIRCPNAATAGGFIMAAAALLQENPKPTDSDIDDVLSNICRCGTYSAIRRAVHRAAAISVAPREELGRRLAIVGGFAGAGLLGVGFWFARERDRLGHRRLLSVKSDEVGLNGWVKIGRDDSVTVAIPRAEMGQGVQTALAMLVAGELDARWDRIRVEEPPGEARSTAMSTS